MMKRMAWSAVCVFLVVALTGCVAQSRYDQLLAANGVQKDKIDEMTRQVQQAQLAGAGLKAQLKSEQEGMDAAQRGALGREGQIAVLKNRAADLEKRLASLDTAPLPLIPAGRDPGPARGTMVKAVTLPPAVIDSLERFAAANKGFEFDRTTGRCTFTGEVLFETGDDVVTPGFEQTLRKFAAVFTGVGRDLFLRIEGHTDNQPVRSSRHASNWHLSAHRAIEVMRVLFKAGVAEERMMVMGYGSQMAVADNGTAAGRARNRRVEVYVMPAPRGVTSGGSRTVAASVEDEAAEASGAPARAGVTGREGL
jgi:flagellar motor protein MotB